MFNAMHFINKLSQIPDEKWARASWEWNGQSCALGLLGEKYNNDGVDTTPESRAFRKLVKRVGDDSGYGINDGNWCDKAAVSFNELGDTPKERVLNALILIHSGIV